MIWKILFPEKDVTVPLPRLFTKETMYGFIETAIDEQCDAKCSTIYFDFAQVQDIEPIGVVVLSNLIQYFRRLKVKVWFKNFRDENSALRFLDDSQFFATYLGKTVFPDSAMRANTVPLHLVESNKTAEFLGFRLMPWIAGQVGLSDKSLQTVKTCFEEVFLNINDHSGVKLGCASAQFSPRKGEIQVAISDFGLGIPSVVGTKVPGLTDQAAIAEACKEGFTTQSNVRNRGAGLPNLMRYVTQRNHGTVLIAAGKGEISAVRGDAGLTKLTPRGAEGFYPGTLVRVILQTDTLEEIVADTELQAFEWS